MKRKKEIIQIVASVLLYSLFLGCGSEPEKYKEKMKSAFDSYDQITKDYDSYMRQMAKEGRGPSIQSGFESAKNMCLRLKKIDVSETPSDFQIPFKKRISLQCDNLNSPSDQITYEGDPSVKELDNIEQELEKVSAKYGYDYKRP